MLVKYEPLNNSDDEFLILKLIFSQSLNSLEEEIIMYQGVIALTLQLHEKKAFHYLVTLDQKNLDQVLGALSSMKNYIGYEPIHEAYQPYTPAAIMVDKDLSIVDPSLEPTTAHYIILEAGESFGTGHHPSTQLLLKWLHHTPLDGCSVYDVGCGSGVLGVYAAMRGAHPVTCIDISQRALIDTQRLAHLNNVEVICAAKIPQHPCEIIISNCEQSVLLALKEDIQNALQPGGYWIITGIIGRIWQKIQTELPQWPIVYKAKQGPWVLIGFQKPPLHF